MSDGRQSRNAEEVGEAAEREQGLREELKDRGEELGAARETISLSQKRLSQLAAMIQSSDDAIISVTLEGLIDTWNPRAERLYGYTANEIVSKPLSVLVPAQCAHEMSRVLPRITQGEHFDHYETVRITKDGTLIDVSVQASPIRNEEGTIIGISWIARDIGERKRAEKERERLLEKLRQANDELVLASVRASRSAEMTQRRAAELQSVLDNMMDAVYATNAEGRLILANQTGMQLLGLSNPADVMRPIAELPGLLRLRHPNKNQVAAEEQPLARALGGEIVVQQEVVVYNPRTRQDRYLRMNAAPIRDEEKRIVGAVAVATDVTELIELDKLKDQFVLVAAHELKTPVTIMKGYAQALQRSAEPLSEPRRKMLDAISRGADRITGIVQGLLDASRVHLGQLQLTTEAVDLTALVEDVVNQMALTTDKHRIRLENEILVVIQGDRERLQLVLIGLIDNAIRYSPLGGDIDVAVETRDGETSVSITDHGVGIPRGKQTRIFERFYRAHTGTPHDYGGMGVGLYISREVVVRHGGRMGFQSEEGKGSTFFFKPAPGSRARRKPLS